MRARYSIASLPLHKNVSSQAKERLLQAVFETVENNLPSTQAAHKYTIPFSTLHPYVKRTRIELGLVDETTIIDENGRR